MLKLLFLIVGGIVLGACGQAPPMEITLRADDAEQILLVTARDMPIRDLLPYAGVTLGPLDRVEPDLYVPLTSGMTISITRVQETFVTEHQTLPFAHRTARNEGLPEGEQRLLQIGSNGEMEITYRVTLENGVEIRREVVRREILVKPVDEVVIVGVQGELQSVPISGTIVYLSGGNAWLIRESSELRRNITGSGDLDGRVFALSRSGNRLLFTRRMSGSEDGPLNSLWLAQPSLVGEEPQPLGITGVIWGAWAPDARRFAYSTAERVSGVPGWKANNDLWLATLTDDPSPQLKQELLIPPTAEIPYAWWGRIYQWAPDGTHLAYSQADEVGILSLADRKLKPLVSFPTFRTRSHWAWVPSVSWSPDGYLLAFVGHEGDIDGLIPEDSPIFSLSVASVDGKIQLNLAEEAGMWAAPSWAPSSTGLLAYGQAQSPRNSQDSRYDLFVVDRDGSNRRRVFPPKGFMGLIAPDVAWSPFGDAVLIEYEGNIYRMDMQRASLEQLTGDGQSSHPRWSE